ncbi:hypothetical protein Q7P37_009213 [Cladosporium fusiforme]
MGAPDDGSAPPTAQNADHERQLEEESLVIMADQAHQVYAPPAHIAARFYRDHANQRRKSSATSSRRNSLSSVHSHGSGLSQRRSSTPAGIQSHSVAQHLRRASILESRKARLADRAAHADQVRLRAALAKAAPRGSISASEEKALAAQIAKEKYLAKVAAACAEEVARAKRIAEEVKERKIADEARARLEMEERHAEAEKRRAEYQRNMQDRRARRADSAEKKLAVVEEDVSVEAAEEAIIDDLEQLAVMDEETAARRIQRAWKLSARRAVLNEFLKLNFNTERIKNDDFDELTLFVAHPNVISATTALLTQLGLQQPNDENAPLNTRTFLSAYMLFGHPAAVLNNRNGAQEQDLISKAKDLTAGFEFTLGRLAPWNNYSPHPNQQETLSQTYTAYTSAFAAWRVQDSSVLIEGMVASFVELDAIWQMVKDDSRGDVASDYRQGIRDNQVKLLSRIQKLAGRDRADALIKKAIRESRRRRPKKRAVAEVRPRGVEAGPEVETAAQQGEEDVPASPLPEDEPEQRSGQLSRLFTNMPTNRVLTHELAVDKDFKLEEDKANAELRDQVYRSICDNMKYAFEIGQGAVWTVSAAENLREKLLRMLKPGNSMYNLISETLNLEQIAQQCQAGLFSYDGFFSFMAGILPKLCAPYRDEEVKKLSDELQGSAAIEGAGEDELSIMIEKLFRLLRMVDGLSLDYSNFMLMNAAPTLIRESAGYEKRHFAMDLEAGKITLERTRAFWHNAESLLVAEADRRDPEAIRRPEDRPSAEKIYAKALVDLAISPASLTDEDVPETLALDTARLRRFRAEAMRIAVIGALFLTAKNLLKRDVRSQWKAEATRLWQLLSTEPYTSSEEEGDPSSSQQPTPAEKATSILTSTHAMPPSTKSHLATTTSRFFAQASANRLSDPVLKVLFQRLKSHIFARLAAGSTAERVRAASSAQESLAACGLAEFGGKVGALVEGLERVRTVDLEGHGGWYEVVARMGEEEN